MALPSPARRARCAVLAFSSAGSGARRHATSGSIPV
jgi:hypothetical protein